jgi:hypothetical protein
MLKLNANFGRLMFDASLVELGIDPCYGKLKALSKRLGFLCKNAEVLHLWAVRPEGAVVFWFMQKLLNKVPG